MEYKANICNSHNFKICKSVVIKTELYKELRLRIRRCKKCFKLFYTQEIMFEPEPEPEKKNYDVFPHSKK